MSVSRDSILLGVSVAALVLLGGALYVTLDRGEPFLASTGSESCTINVLSIDDHLDTYMNGLTPNSYTIAAAIRELNTNDKSATLILMDSVGGYPAAGEEIADALYESEKPTVTFVRGAALSAAYWVSSATDHIIALSTAMIGSIGVTGSYLDETALNIQEGYAFQEIVSGEYKEVGNVNKPLQDEHRAYLQEQTDTIFTLYRAAVLQNRNLTNEEFEKVADGKSYFAEEALTLGLIDEVGGLSHVYAHITDVLQTTPDEVVLCEPIFLGAE